MTEYVLMGREYAYMPEYVWIYDNRRGPEYVF